MRRLVPLVVVLAVLALAFVWATGGYPVGPDDAGDEASPSPAGGARRASSVLVGDVSERRGGEAVETLVPALPVGLPSWGVEGLVRRPGRVGAPWSRLPLHVVLEGPEGALLDLAATTDEDGRYRVGPIDLPRVPRRSRHGLALVLCFGDEERDVATSRLPREALVQAIHEAEGDVRWIHLDAVRAEGRQIEGRLLTSGRHPVAGVYVHVRGATGLNFPTGLEGRFSCHVSTGPGDPLAIELEMEGAFDLRFEATLPLPEEDGLLDILLPPEREVSGRVLDGEGRGIGGVHLVLSGPGWEPNERLGLDSNEVEIHLLPSSSVFGFFVDRLPTRSAADGTFAFPGLVAGKPYELWWPGDDERWQKLDQEIRADDADLVVVLERHVFEVRLVEEGTGRPLQGVDLVLRPDDDQAEAFRRRMRPFLEEATPSEVGTIGVAGERFRILAWAPGYAFTTFDWKMPQASGRYEAVVPLRGLDPPPVVRLDCVDGAGRMLGPVPLVFRRPVGDLTFFPLAPTAAVEEGRLVFRDLPPGPVGWATPEKLGHPPNGRWRFVLPAEGTFEVPEEGELELSLPCPLGGSVRLHLPRDARATLGEIVLLDADGGEARPWWYARSAADDEGWEFVYIDSGSFVPDGRVFESEALPPGDWVLVIEENEHGEAQRIPLRITAGEITEVR